MAVFKDHILKLGLRREMLHLCEMLRAPAWFMLTFHTCCRHKHFVGCVKELSSL